MKRLGIFLLCAILFTGCGAAPARDTVHCRVVTRITVSRGTALQQYTEPQKMARILNYLRMLRLNATAAPAPEIPSEELYDITLYLSDGCTRSYRQLGDRLISIDGGPWQTIDQDRAASLWLLLKVTPPDE